MNQQRETLLEHRITVLEQALTSIEIALKLLQKKDDPDEDEADGEENDPADPTPTDPEIIWELCIQNLAQSEALLARIDAQLDALTYTETPP